MTMKPNTETARHFGAYLQKRRTDKGLTQAYVAERLDKNGPTISLVENGKRALKEEEVAVWAKAYHIGPKALQQAYKDVENSYPEEKHAKTTMLRRSMKGKDLAFNQMRVQCMNENCGHYGKLRLVSFPIIGSELFVHSNVMCSCSWMPVIKETPTG